MKNEQENEQDVRQALNECILVCVNYGKNAERLINRGWKIAVSFHAPLIILTVDPPKSNQYSQEKLKNIESWKQMAAKMHAEFLQIDSNQRSVAQVIIDVCKEKQVTQIVMGQTAQTRWEGLVKGSITNEILKQIDFADMHIVAVQREYLPSDDEYETGERAFMVPSHQGYQLVFDPPEKNGIEGLFFKYCSTDFNSGKFRYRHNQEFVVVKVSDGMVLEVNELRNNQID